MSSATSSSPPALHESAALLRGALDRPERELLAPGGPWNLSQTLQHCAQTVRYSVVGYPRLKPALFRATAGALAKRLFLRRGAMRHPLGAEIDGAPPLVADRPVAEAVADFEDAVNLFTAHTADHAPHPAYGRCTHEEFERLHALHLAEHLPGLTRG
ncbi:DUF1569 domain-containing protein [Streptomyces justiciae]|uniref:DUF1569 domain-containing protein n=1 Tax=Streptomyces justiciae TaxID=2780140 RepID=UPI0018824855|nr:DUF1569 domain-containing protein [Streptomyces justiciae]MBE8470693.1 DUF1569 domain-containing protein [Streptomyces justiciae]MCW8378636.1 DUF1569 domain-containing protein [Streptomyces justiciae]